MEKLAHPDVKSRLEALPEWSEVSDSIQRTYQFEDFLAAMRFVNAVAEHAERVQHHPDILVRWNKVTLTLSTHDAGGITSKDFQSAGAYDAMAG